MKLALIVSVFAFMGASQAFADAPGAYPQNPQYPQYPPQQQPYPQYPDGNQPPPIEAPIEQPGCVGCVVPVQPRPCVKVACRQVAPPVLPLPHGVPGYGYGGFGIQRVCTVHHAGGWIYTIAYANQPITHVHASQLQLIRVQLMRQGICHAFM